METREEWLKETQRLFEVEDYYSITNIKLVYEVKIRLSENIHSESFEGFEIRGRKEKITLHNETYKNG